MNTPNWDYWQNVASVELHEAVALSCDVDPEHIEETDDTRASLERRVQIAISHADKGTLPCEHVMPELLFTGEGSPERYMVALSDFRAWGESLPRPLTFPPKFPRGNERAPQRWPWGGYETELLRLLARAQRQWWSTWEPGIKPPKSKDVAAWIAKQTIKGEPVSRAVAKAMAQILRADGLPNRSA